MGRVVFGEAFSYHHLDQGVISQRTWCVNDEHREPCNYQYGEVKKKMLAQCFGKACGSMGRFRGALNARERACDNKGEQNRQKDKGASCQNGGRKGIENSVEGLTARKAVTADCGAGKHECWHEDSKQAMLLDMCLHHVTT